MGEEGRGGRGGREEKKEGMAEKGREGENVPV